MEGGTPSQQITHLSRPCRHYSASNETISLSLITVHGTQLMASDSTPYTVMSLYIRTSLASNKQHKVGVSSTTNLNYTSVVVSGGSLTESYTSQNQDRPHWPSWHVPKYIHID